MQGNYGSGSMIGGSTVAPRPMATVTNNLERATDLSKLLGDTLNSARATADRIDGSVPPPAEVGRNDTAKLVVNSSAEATASVLNDCDILLRAIRDQLQRIDARI